MELYVLSVYFAMQTLTTVGYGDYSPSTNGSRIFTMFYIFSGIAIVGRIIDKFAVSIQEYAERKAAERRKLCSRFRSQHSSPIKFGFSLSLEIFFSKSIICLLYFL